MHRESPLSNLLNEWRARVFFMNVDDMLGLFFNERPKNKSLLLKMFLQIIQQKQQEIEECHRAINLLIKQISGDVGNKTTPIANLESIKLPDLGLQKQLSKALSERSKAKSSVASQTAKNEDNANKVYNSGSRLHAARKKFSSFDSPNSPDQDTSLQDNWYFKQCQQNLEMKTKECESLQEEVKQLTSENKQLKIRISLLQRTRQHQSPIRIN